ncbi:Exocyst complex protein EXO70 [Wickerhamomyces ciferrii]|uniref:Exocyst complex protein EXO70 n=1 Tax=Wickerhamomyces ciferrii (strain ATCC 14091 / BCRC 22168 / CBS 111 / JCM 3599 / NBRC 0793 / NRRL Y-1031 F-60-10) TaxID=1206466 RepID=K0KAQ4_WICCF|nr:Exocyst complex protein EXO70 [Wickerhamomyces ciferrii]CCH42075.1 Exocyst complex protein EXO70 [Wickerhamomyces ciferrii]
MSLSQISVDIDEADAVVLQESLLKTRSLIASISQSLNKIESSSSNSEKLLKPIIEKNKKLSIFSKNVNDSLLAVSNVQGIASEASIYESKLNERIDNVKNYIITINKSQNILLKLKDNNGGGSNGEYRGISENLSKTIMDSEFKLHQFFKELIKSDSQPFDPQIFMNQLKPFPFLSVSKIRDVGLIMAYFNDQKNPIDDLYIDSRSNLILKSLAFLEPFTKINNQMDKVPYEKGSNGINNYTEAFLGFLSNEYALLESILNENNDQIITIYQKLIRNSIENYSKIITNLINSIENSITNLGSLSFELINNLSKILSFLKSKSFKESYPSLSKNLNSSQSIAKSLFKELLIYTENRVSSLTTIPQDSGVSEATVDIMSKIRKISEYKFEQINLMNGFKAGSWIPQPSPQWLSHFSSISHTTIIDDSDPKQLLSSYYLDVIDALIVNLEIKSLNFIKKKQTLGFFLITNITLVEQIISRSQLNNILDSTGWSRLEKLKKRSLNFFLTGWKQVAAYLLDVNVVGKLSSKDREIIKEKFKNFNLEFDELVKSYKAYNITDQSLKKFLSKEISFISPLYKRFYDKHSSGDFTKHTDKYIKYNPMEFDKILESLGK